MGGLEYAAFIVPILLLLVLLEYLISKRKGVDAYSLSDTIVNMCCGVLERLFDFFWVVMMYFVFAFLFEQVAFWQIPLNPLTWVVALFIGDFLAYWHHRLSHEINFLWAAHIVHHQSEELNLTTVFRVSAFAVINRSFFWIWMPMMGFDPLTTTSVIVFIGLFQFVTHSRLVGKLGFLEHIFVTPSHHRVHHARNEKYLDKNYGHVFIIWDKLLGTFTPEEEEPDYGITTGFGSSNPFRAYFFYWADLFRRARETPDWKEKFLVFLKPPSWNPEGATSTPAEYQKDKNGKRIKYSSNTPFRLQLYVLFSALGTISLFIWLMLIKKAYETPTVSELVADMTIIHITAIIVFSIFVHGVLLDRKVWSLKLEYFRLAYLAFGLPLLFWGFKFSWIIIPITLIYLIIMAFWIIRMRNYFEENSRIGHVSGLTT